VKLLDGQIMLDKANQVTLPSNMPSGMTAEVA